MINRDLLQKLSKNAEVELDDNMLSQFQVYADELIGENEKYNLTSITDPEEVVIKHFVDSIMLLKYFDLDYNTKIIDIGSGAGFPGIPLLIAKNNRLDLTLVDSRLKRVAFMDEVLKRCGLNANPICARAESLGVEARYREQFDVATARAVAPLNILCELCMPLVKVGGYFVSLKGAQDECDEAKNAVSVLGGELESNVSYKLENGDTRSIVIIKKISQTPTEYPRKNKKIQTKPL